MFRSYKGALAFMAVTMLGAVSLVGWEDNEGALVKAAADLERQRAMMADQDDERSDSPPPVGFAPADPAKVEFTPDEDLVDAAGGYDPTPDIEQPFSTQPLVDPQEVEVTIVDRGGEIVIE